MPRCQEGQRLRSRFFLTRIDDSNSHLKVGGRIRYDNYNALCVTNGIGSGTICHDRNEKRAFREYVFHVVLAMNYICSVCGPYFFSQATEHNTC
jgi:hypothetical protein